MNRTRWLKTLKLVSLVGALLTIWLPSHVAAQLNAGGLPTLEAGTLHRGQSATLLPDGRWLLVGGETRDGVSAAVEIFDANTRARMTSSLTLQQARAWHSATLLPSGRVLVFGGIGVDGGLVSTAELFDPSTGNVASLTETGLLARAFHTATVLTDGNVLIAGGVLADGSIAAQAALWNPRTGLAEPLSASLDKPRYGHAATLLPNEPVMISGGLGRHDEHVGSLEQYDPRERRFRELVDNDPDLIAPYANSPLPPSIEASIPVNGAMSVVLDAFVTLRFSRPIDVQTLNQETVVLFGPNGPVASKVVPVERGMLLFVTPNVELRPGTTYTLFVRDAKDTARRELPFAAITFSTRSLGGGSSELRPTQGDTGRAPANGSFGTRDGAASGSAAEAANAANAAASMLADAQASDSPTNVPDARATAAADDVDGDEFWNPADKNRSGDWHTGRGDGRERLASLSSVRDALGATALAGMVLLQSEKPLKDVTVSIGARSTMTDNQGQFLLKGLKPGRQELLIDGTTAGSGKQYAKFAVLVDVQSGQTNALPYIVWMPRIRPSDVVRIPSPTTQDVVVTNPLIPGLELRIPKGVVLRDRDGKVVTDVSITPAPMDRPSFPLPMPVAVYFVIQPGMAYVESIEPGVVKGVQLVYPNYWLAPRGTSADFYNYDTTKDGWYVYGQGKVDDTGKQIVADAGVEFYQFSGAMVAGPGGPPPPPNPPPPCPSNVCCFPPADGGGGGGDSGADGDPVICRTGAFTHRRTDLAIDDIIPLSVTRTYRTDDVTSQRQFGFGTNSEYSIYLYFPAPYTYSSVDLIQADGARIHFLRTSAGTGYTDAVFEHTTTPTRFYKSVMTWNSTASRWELKLTDQTVMSFGYTQTAPLMSVRDRFGNTVSIVRPIGVGSIDRITSPSGKFIRFTYDVDGHVVLSMDSIGRTVGYTYDATGRLIRATDPTGAHEDYSYDTAGRMQTIVDKRGNTMVNNVYDANGRVSMQTLADGAVYRFAYSTDANGKVVQADITNPRGFIRRTIFNSDGYVVTNIFPLGDAIERTTTFTRQPGTNLVTSITDAMGRVTAYQYDAQGNRISATKLYGTAQAVTTFTSFDSRFNLPSTITDELGQITTFNYDANGNLATVTDALGQTAAVQHNPSGQMTGVQNMSGRAVSISYSQGIPGSVIDALGQTTTFLSDGIGRNVAITDAIGAQARTVYDDVNRTLTMVDPMAGVTTMRYEPNGNILSVSDARGSVTSYSYDSRNRVASRVDALGRTESFSYDGLGNATRMTDRNGRVTNYSFDALNRLTQIAYQDGSTTSYTYDSGNRLTRIADSNGETLTRSYDALDRLSQETSSRGTVSYTYDAAGRRTSMLVAGQPMVTYSYDAGDRLVGVTQGGNSITYAYDSANRRTSMTYPSGITAAYAYDYASRGL